MRIAVSVQDLETNKATRYPSLTEAFNAIGCTVNAYRKHMKTGCPIKGRYVIAQRMARKARRKHRDKRYVKTYVIYRDGTRQEFDSEVQLAKTLYVSKVTLYRYLNGFDLNKSVISEKVKEVGYL